MGSVFKPSTSRVNPLEDNQRFIQEQLGQQLSAMLSNLGVGAIARGLNYLDDPRALRARSRGYDSLNSFLSEGQAKKYYREAFLNPAMRSYDTDIEPRIRDAFARVGGVSDRRGVASADALSGLTSAANQQFSQAVMADRANQLAATQFAVNAPMQQHLGQIQGLTQLLQTALGYTQPTSEVIAQPSPFSTAMGFAGQLGGGALAGGLAGGKLGSRSAARAARMGAGPTLGF